LIKIDSKFEVFINVLIKIDSKFEVSTKVLIKIDTRFEIFAVVLINIKSSETDTSQLSKCHRYFGTPYSLTPFK
jgi:hypothetical protein